MMKIQFIIIIIIAFELLQHRSGGGEAAPIGPMPKMVATEVSSSSSSSSLLLQIDHYGFLADGSRTMSSSEAVFLGECSSLPFVFPASSGRGKGVIGLGSNVSILDLDFVDKTSGNDGSFVFHSNHLKQNHFFAGLTDGNDDDEGGMVAVPFEFLVLSTRGAEIAVSCDAPSDVIVLYTDDAKVDPVQATSKREDNHHQVSVQLLQQQGQAHAEFVHGKAFRKQQQHQSGGGNDVRRLQETSRRALMITDTTGGEVRVDFDGEEDDDDDMLVLQVDVVVDDDDDNNKKHVYRTILMDATQQAKAATSARPRTSLFTIQSTQVDANGDVRLTFVASDGSSLEEHGEQLLFVVRLGMEIEAQVVSVVDVQAMLSTTTTTSDGTTAGTAAMTIHGGWFRRKLGSLGLDTTTASNWDVIVQDAYATNPEDGYQVVARLDQHPVRLDTRERFVAVLEHHRISQHGGGDATSYEQEIITQEMRQGRKPPHPHGRRNTKTLLHKKIVVHGYCSGIDTFPMTQFTNAVRFEDPNANRSHNQFALAIWQFAKDSGIDGCGIIGHSQGGAAALHLQNHYWSCLDYASEGGDRLIQSVGTPYQGTPLAGNLAALGKIFGAGCGANNDLTYKGASTWLAGIADRSTVYYYTTSFENKWWRYDYCHLVSDLLLKDPDDGTTEQWAGQLPGGHSLGHQELQCHTSSMRDAFQCGDVTRNADMNAHAKY